MDRRCLRGSGYDLLTCLAGFFKIFCRGPSRILPRSNDSASPMADRRAYAAHLQYPQMRNAAMPCSGAMRSRCVCKLRARDLDARLRCAIVCAIRSKGKDCCRDTKCHGERSRQPQPIVTLRIPNAHSHEETSERKRRPRRRKHDTYEYDWHCGKCAQSKGIAGRGSSGGKERRDSEYAKKWNPKYRVQNNHADQDS